MEKTCRLMFNIIIRFAETTNCDGSQATTSKKLHSITTPLVASNPNPDVSKKQMKILKEKKRALKRL